MARNTHEIYGGKSTPKQIVRAKQYRAKGLSYRQIAEKLGVTVYTVHGWVNGYQPSDPAIWDEVERMGARRYLAGLPGGKGKGKASTAKPKKATKSSKGAKSSRPKARARKPR